jgi:hypothetical protein
MKIPKVRSLRQNQIIALAYREAIKNAELAEFALKNQTAFIVFVGSADGADKAGCTKSEIIFGLLLGFIVGALYLVGRNIIRID